MKRWLRRVAALTALLGLLWLWAYAEELFPPETISGQMVHVRDGDTIDLDGATVRLTGIDAPEYHQTCQDAAGAEWPCGQTARSRLVSLVTGSRVTCALLAEDKYRRHVGKCATPAQPDLGEAMVRAGLAVSPAMHGEASYADAQTEAREARRGLWQGRFVEPAQWRVQHLLDPAAVPDAR